MSTQNYEFQKSDVNVNAPATDHQDIKEGILTALACSFGAVEPFDAAANIPQVGQFWYDSGLSPPRLRMYNGTGWIDLFYMDTGIPVNAPTVSIEAAWPVNSVYLTTDATNPGTLFGFGSWVPFAAGLAIVGAGTHNDGTVSKTYAVGDPVEGLHEVALTGSQIPAHTHPYNDVRHNSTSQNITAGISGGQFNFINSIPQNDVARTTSAQSGTTGQRHENRMPFEVVNCWRRTA